MSSYWASSRACNSPPAIDPLGQVGNTGDKICLGILITVWEGQLALTYIPCFTAWIRSVCLFVEYGRDTVAGHQCTLVIGAYGRLLSSTVCRV